MNGLLMAKLNELHINIVLVNNDGEVSFHIYLKNDQLQNILSDYLEHQQA